MNIKNLKIGDLICFEVCNPYRDSAFISDSQKYYENTYGVISVIVDEYYTRNKLQHFIALPLVLTSNSNQYKIKTANYIADELRRRKWHKVSSSAFSFADTSTIYDMIRKI